MWTKQSPPPIGYNLSIRIACPECGNNLHFYPSRLSIKHAYCSNEYCALLGADLFIELTNNACQIVENKP
jgi:hypothetical protein